jgi:hypothetical protein
MARTPRVNSAANRRPNLTPCARLKTPVCTYRNRAHGLWNPINTRATRCDVIRSDVCRIPRAERPACRTGMLGAIPLVAAALKLLELEILVSDQVQRALLELKPDDALGRHQQRGG